MELTAQIANETNVHSREINNGESTRKVIGDEIGGTNTADVNNGDVSCGAHMGEVCGN